MIDPAAVAAAAKLSQAVNDRWVAAIALAGSAAAVAAAFAASRRDLASRSAAAADCSSGEPGWLDRLRSAQGMVRFRLLSRLFASRPSAEDSPLTVLRVSVLRSARRCATAAPAVGSGASFWT